jgi:hypothetical protein
MTVDKFAMAFCDTAAAPRFARRDGRGRPSLHLRRLQVTLGAAKVGAGVGVVHEKVRPGGICLCIHRLFVNRREDQGTWGLAREDAREGARHHTQGRS